MSIQVEIDGRFGRIEVIGPFEFATHKEFRAAADAVIKRADIEAITVDLSKSEYIDSSALGMLLLLREQATPRAVSIIVASEMVLAVLRMSCFERIFTLEIQAASASEPPLETISTPENGAANHSFDMPEHLAAAIAQTDKLLVAAGLPTYQELLKRR